MKKFHSNSIKALAFSASAIAFVMAGPVYAQDAEEPQEEEEEQVSVGTDAKGRTTEGNITVTGSRIVRDTYSSISPLQVLTTENQQAVGAFDPAQILQRSEAAAGQQIDATFQGFVLDNGPGSQTLNLRGLGADRNLLLVNGRRLSPAGVEGAPSNPSLNLIPASLVDRYDFLLDGASSVYGSDAVAGVVNVILRKDFDGLEVQLNGNLNEYGAGHDFTVSAAWGFNTDRAVFGIGAEWRRVDSYRLADRPFLAGCDRNFEIDQNGVIRTLDVQSNAIARSRSNGQIGLRQQECKPGGFGSAVQLAGSPTFLGTVFFDPRQYGLTAGGQPIAGNSGVPFFSDNVNAFNDPIDRNGDGLQDIDPVDYGQVDPTRVFIPQQDTYNVFAYGEYTLPGAANITPYFEAGYSRFETFQPNGGQPQFFPWVPSGNAFNPCNIAAGGVDCRAADNNFQQVLPGQPNAGRSPNVGPRPSLASLAVRPVVFIDGDRNNTDVTQEQYRGVLGVRGDLPFIGSSWTFDVSGVYSRSQGSSVRRGIREDKLAFALGIDPTADFGGTPANTVDNDGDGIADDYISLPVSPMLLATTGVAGGTPCNAAGLRNPNLAPPDLLQGCVPVNLFAPSIYGTPGLTSAPIGDFATQAERDYLFGVRSFDTVYEQKILSGYITGDLFELPAGPVGVVLGGEWREDSIDSQPNFVASNGLFWGFFADGGATGSKWIRELYGEIDLPLQAGKPMVEELTVKAAGRITDEEFYGTNGTFSLGMGWRPVAPLLFKFSYGTSFRAPNLRENFLLSQSGFGNLFDPCAVPNAAFSAANGYNQADDPRDPAILENCRREGRDPTRVGIDEGRTNTVQVNSTQVFSGGSLDIDPETSRSITTGFAFEEDWASGFEFAFNFNYFDIKLKDSIVEATGGFIIADCFSRLEGGRSPFCDRIVASDQISNRFLITQVNSAFINLDEEAVRGIDINTTFSYPVMVGDEEVDLTLNLTANHLIERSTTTRDAAGNRFTDDFAGRFFFPSWIGRATFNVRYSDFLFTWQTRYIGPVSQDPDFVDPFSDAFGFGPDGVATGFTSATCLGGGSRNPAGTPNAGQPNGIVPGDGVFCRNVGFADEWFEHTASVRWDNGDLRVIVGVNNIFNTDPPRVDSSEVLAIGNTPLGGGYNLDGREYFAQLLYRF